MMICCLECVLTFFLGAFWTDLDLDFDLLVFVRSIADDISTAFPFPFPFPLGVAFTFALVVVVVGEGRMMVSNPNKLRFSSTLL